MASGLIQLAPKPWVAFDDVQKEITLNGPADADIRTATIALTFRTPPGLIGQVASFRQAWDSVLNPYVRFSLRINGGIPNQYNSLQAQIAAPEQDVDLPVPIKIEQLSLIEVLVFVLTGASFPGNFTSRVICKYANP